MRLRLLLTLAVVAAGLAVLFLLTYGRDESGDQVERPQVWSFDLRDLQRVEIALPHDQLAEAWFQEDRVWYFDRPGLPQVEMDRWGGGVPYLLSGPGANRLIADDLDPEGREIYGLQAPRMTIHLEYGGQYGERAESGDGGGSIDLVIGNDTLDTFSFYVQLVGAKKVYTVDRSWYDVMERLVLDPPYLPQ